MIESVVESFYNNLIAEDRYRMILDGLQVTLLITLCAALLGTLLGGLVCWMRMNRRLWLQQVAKALPSPRNRWCMRRPITASSI